MTNKINQKNPRRAAWLELYTVQKSRVTRPVPSVVRGRPPRIGSLKQFHSYISEADEKLLVNWRNKFSRLTGRNITLGEVAGLLARILNDRFEVVRMKTEPENIEALVDLLVGEEKRAAATAKKGKNDLSVQEIEGLSGTK
jgi:hypothetical protein